MKKAVIIRTDGTTETIDLSTDELAQLQGAVGGWVEAIDLNDSLTMWVNEEGKLTGLPHNPGAQRYWDSAFGPGTDFIVGNAVLTGGIDGEGDTIGLDDATVQALSELREIVLG